MERARGNSRAKVWMVVCAIALLMSTSAQAREDKASMTAVPSNDSTLMRKDGLLPVWIDREKGRILLSLPPADATGVNGRFLYVTALKTGLGASDLNIDQGSTRQPRILAFRRIGDKVIADYENTRFNAAGGSLDAQRAVRDSFALSTVWMAKIESVTPQGGVLIDISSFLKSDVMDISADLEAGGEKGYRLDVDLSVVDPAAVKVFPENIEFDVRETFASETPGAQMRNIVPEPRRVTFEVQHNLIKLPEPGFVPREFDPRSGSSDILTYNYAAPLDHSVAMRLAHRFRLEKTDPAATLSPVKKPIVFHIDRAAPEGIRAALIEGASWWRGAFEAAGFKDALRIELLPEGADPSDVRYNMIRWVDRDAAGYSWGASIADPRTGEIIKASIRLDAMVLRRNMQFLEGLLGADWSDGGGNDIEQIALNRVRLLAAHEVGHGLGFSHNFGASILGRSSVMDYYSPRIKLSEGHLDLSDAYMRDIGPWDRFLVDWLYSTVPAGAPGVAALADKAEAAAEHLRFVKDADALDAGSGHAYGAIKDDGSDPIAELHHMLGVRRVAMAQFGERALRAGEALEMLRVKFAPIYLLHRAQAEAVTKLIGGVDYGYGVKGDRSAQAIVVTPALQRAAIDAVLAAIKPDVLDTPERLIALLSSGQAGVDDRQTTTQMFASSGGPIYDSLLVADVGAIVVLDALTAPERLNRLVDQHRRDANAPAVSELLQRLLDAVFTPADGRYAEIARRVQTRTVLSLVAAANDQKISSAAAAAIEQSLRDLATRLKAAKNGDLQEQAHRAHLLTLLQNKDEMKRMLAVPRPEIPGG
jgi:Met-zincin/Domain of unknown function (DUF5117)